MSKTRHIGLLANDAKARSREVIQALVHEFSGHGIQLHLDHRAARLIGAQSELSEPDLADMCELLIVLGGDGTILQVLHALNDTLPPLFGINLGTLGFLTTVGANEFLLAAQAIISGEYKLSHRTLLRVEILREGQVMAKRVALNDVVISRGELSRLIRLSVRVGDDAVTEYNADGLIVATPTGSTAYSLSAGGPILTPDSGVFVLNPICPHVLTNRALILSDDSVIQIEPAKEQAGIFFTLDGQNVQLLQAGETVRISKAHRRLPLASLAHMSYFEVLRQKLKWSGTAL